MTTNTLYSARSRSLLGVILLPALLIRGPADRRQPPTPCVFTGTTRCVGTFDAMPKAADLLNLKPQFRLAGHYKRKGQTMGEAATFINPDARAMTLEDLQNGQYLVIGAIRYPAGDPQYDPYYKKAGKNLPAGDDVYRWAIFIVTHPDNPPPGYSVIGVWTMYSIDKNTNALVQLHTGKIVRCAHTTTTNEEFPDDPYSYFSNCDGGQSMAKAAKAAKTPEATIVRYLNAVRGQDTTMARSLDALLAARLKLLDAQSNRDQRAAPKSGGQPQPRLAGLSIAQEIAALRVLTARPLLPDSDQYWFSCGPGCCTADM